MRPSRPTCFRGHLGRGHAKATALPPGAARAVGDEPYRWSSRKRAKTLPTVVVASRCGAATTQEEVAAQPPEKRVDRTGYCIFFAKLRNYGATKSFVRQVTPSLPLAPHHGSGTACVIQNCRA